jgi:3-oxoacyl-[acyl-carrier-protein] synthase-1
LLQAGKYQNAIVVGCDRFSRFVLSGFQSFQAISNAPCKPFDAERNGINLGEAAATIILSATGENEPLAILSGGSTSNDANHISGPSRTGIELALAISRAITEAGITNKDIDIISAHGTATLYNDEMEAKAFTLAGLNNTPLHSFKGYIGHTLGAAGVAESVMLLEAIRCQNIIPSAGFNQSASGQTLNVSTFPISANINYALKTASGFGGCNAAMVWAKL